MNIETSGAVSAKLKSDMLDRYNDFNQLQSALQSGNISQAQTAFAGFQQVIDKIVTESGSNSLFAAGTQPNSDLRALGNALRSGDLATSQKAFATLKADIQSSGQISGTIKGDTTDHFHPKRSTVSQNMQSFGNHASQSAKGKSAATVLNLEA